MDTEIDSVVITVQDVTEQVLEIRKDYHKREAFGDWTISFLFENKLGQRRAFFI